MNTYATPRSADQKVFAVAPMMDWTDRHCRYFHRLLTKKALLYTEMVVAEAVIHGPLERLLRFDETEHPVALQLGGSDPQKLAAAARIGADFGYDEVNLNVGCPSDRVQSGTFGACLMREPALVARCVAAMKSAVAIPVTVKCRLGVDEQDPEVALDALANDVIGAGADALWVHARKAWLQGLSPKENRTVPPLDYERVYRLKRRLPEHFIGINGGIDDLGQAQDNLAHVDGVMMGRAAYQNPDLLCGIDAMLAGSGSTPVVPDHAAIIAAMEDYAGRHIAAGGRLAHVTRHMIGLFHGRPGARQWRQILSGEVNSPGADAGLISRAYGAITLARESTAA